MKGVERVLKLRMKVNFEFALFGYSLYVDEWTVEVKIETEIEWGMTGMKMPSWAPSLSIRLTIYQTEERDWLICLTFGVVWSGVM